MLESSKSTVIRGHEGHAHARADQTLDRAVVIRPQHHGGFVLIDWWYGRNEIHQIVLSATLDDPSRPAPHPLPAVGCVWELSVVHFERRAWLRHVLANPDGRPSPAAYMEEAIQRRHVSGRSEASTPSIGQDESWHWTYESLGRKLRA